MENTHEKLEALLKQLRAEDHKLTAQKQALNECVWLALKCRHLLKTGEISDFEQANKELIEAQKKYNEMALTNLFFGL